MGFSLSFDRSAEIKYEGRIVISAVDDRTGAVTLASTVNGVTLTHTGASKIMYTLPADKQVKLQIAYTDKNGNPANVDGAVAWASSDESIAKVEPFSVQPVASKIAAKRGTTASETAAAATPPENSIVNLVPGTSVGTCQITAKADADLGDGVRELVTLLDVEVVAGEAVAGTITPVGEQTPVP